MPKPKQKGKCLVGAMKKPLSSCAPLKDKRTGLVMKKPSSQSLRINDMLNSSARMSGIGSLRKAFASRQKRKADGISSDSSEPEFKVCNHRCDVCFDEQGVTKWPSFCRFHVGDKHELDEMDNEIHECVDCVIEKEELVRIDTLPLSESCKPKQLGFWEQRQAKALGWYHATQALARKKAMSLSESTSGVKLEKSNVKVERGVETDDLFARARNAAAEELEKARDEYRTIHCKSPPKLEWTDNSSGFIVNCDDLGNTPIDVERPRWKAGSIGFDAGE